MSAHIICHTFEKIAGIPDIIQVLTKTFGYDGVCFPKYTLQLFSWWNTNEISSDTIFTALDWLFSKGIIYIQ